MIGIIDYGMGNLHSVKNACDFLGLESFVSDDEKNLAKADGLILPGVGAFPDAMKCLSDEKQTFAWDMSWNAAALRHRI